MKWFANILILLITCTLQAQPPGLVLTPGGFEPVKITVPQMPNEKLVDLTREWAMEANRNYDVDVTEVTDNSLTVTSFRNNGFIYRSKGETYQHRIKYQMKFSFSGTFYTVTFSVPEIYNDDILLKYTLPDYFDSKGNLKEGYTELKPSIENTVNTLVESHYNFIVNYK
ncbi:MAG: hypothetical protein ACO1N9_11435 [Flavobacterium sp.]